MNGQVRESFIEEQIQQIERIPVFGPYLGMLAAAQLSFADALGLLQLRNALRYSQAPFDTPADAPIRAPARSAIEAQSAETLRKAA